MFLAINEMKKEKLRYGLIVTVITLISFLIFIISSLALGLVNENTSAINSWQTNTVTMNRDANGNLSQSLIVKDDVNHKNDYHKNSVIAVTPAIARYSSHRQTVNYIGIIKNQSIYRSLNLTSGRMPDKKSEVVVSEKLKNKGLKLGNQVKLGVNTTKVKVVGFVKNAEYNTSPVIYGRLSLWGPIKGVGPNFYASGIVSQRKYHNNSSNLKTYSKDRFLNKLPGYSAENNTFIFMISFLFIISIVIVAIFLYILTIQKLPNYAVLRAQGIPSRYLIINTFGETLVIMISSVILGIILYFATINFLPKELPIYFNYSFLGVAALGLIITGLIGALIPARLIAKIDPTSVL